MSAFPGLPALPSATAALFQAVTLLTGDLIGGFVSAPQWGIFLDGEPVVLADNVVSVDFKQDFVISNYPVEQGAFASYNKVQRPFEAKVRFSTGGSQADREAFLQSIADIIGDTNIYDVVTPEATYPSVNLTHQDYRRTATEGAGLITVDVWCEEVRSATSQTSNTAAANSNVGGVAAGGGIAIPRVSQGFDGINNPQSADAAPQVVGGSVQPQTPTAAQQAAADQVLSQSMLPF